MRGTCKLPDCRFPHPPFDLHPPEEPAGEHVVTARPGMPIWRPGQPGGGASPKPLAAPPPPAAAAASAVAAGAGAGGASMASAAEALAAQLGLSSVRELSQLLSPDELQASLLLMQEQLNASAGQAAAAAPSATQSTAQQQLEYAAAWAAETGAEGWDAESGRASACSESGASGATGGAVFLPGGPRVLDRTGAWVCTCGRRNRGGAGGGSRVAGKLCTNPKCSQRVCRKWLTGPCAADCPFLHPPFDAAAEWAPAPGAKAALWQGAPRWKSPAAAAAAAARQQPAPPPAQNPWQRNQQQQQQPAQQAAQPPAEQPVPNAWLAAQQQQQQAAVQQQQHDAAAAAAAVSRGWDPFSSFGFAPMAAAPMAAPEPEPRRDSHLPLAAVAMLARPASTPLVQPAAAGGGGGGVGGAEDVDDLLQHLGIAAWEAAAAAPTSPPAGAAASMGAFSAAHAAHAAAAGSGALGGGGLLAGSAFGAGPGASLGLGLDLAGAGGPLNGSADYTGCLGALAQCLWRCADFRAQARGRVSGGRTVLPGVSAHAAAAAAARTACLRRLPSSLVTLHHSPTSLTYPPPSPPLPAGHVLGARGVWPRRSTGRPQPPLPGPGRGGAAAPGRGPAAGGGHAPPRPGLRV